MIQDIENGKVNLVITKDLSRLGRDYIMTGFYTENYFNDNRVRYVVINDWIGTINDNNAIAPTIRSLMINGVITIAGVTIGTAVINYGLTYVY